MGTYVPNAKDEQMELLRETGLSSMEDLFSMIPEEVKLKEGLDMDPGRSEMEVLGDMEEMASENRIFGSIFRGAGAYDHYIPATVSHVISNETLQTAYTPYQAEISQGVLQSIFEYQTGICELTGMDVSNASVYDGATAAAEAVSMCRERKRNRALVSAAVDPKILEVVRTYCFGNGMSLDIIPEKDYATDVDALKEMLDDETACVLIQHPNYYGTLEDAGKIGDIIADTKARYIMSVNPISLGMIRTPAEYGAHIAVGDGQPLGLPMAFGGPYLGFMAAKDELKRKLPGRIVGQTVDTEGRPGYVLTLQAREQHIRREKASSNICSNQALCALAVGVYLATLGPDGLAEAASQCTSKAHYMAQKLSQVGFVVKNGEFFHEFVTEAQIGSQDVVRALEDEGILGGLPLDENRILWCCTEKNSREDIDRVLEILSGLGTAPSGADGKEVG